MKLAGRVFWYLFQGVRSKISLSADFAYWWLLLDGAVAVCVLFQAVFDNSAAESTLGHLEHISGYFLLTVSFYQRFDNGLFFVLQRNKISV